MLHMVKVQSVAKSYVTHPMQKKKNSSEQKVKGS